MIARRSPAGLALFALGALSLAAGCIQQMADQPSYRPLQASKFFSDGRASRPLVEGTIARGQLRLDDHLYRGTVNGQPATEFPFEVTEAVLERGQKRYNIYCAPCHDQAGSGNGMIVRRGFHKPPSFHTDKLREAPVGQLYDVIANGYRLMPAYSAQIPVDDRWAIVAYMRALQLSQNATPADVPREELQKLEAMAP